ncbi:hypothetical protein EDD18DRAFT_1356851 [Armillaria luteobubalina]|uniref:Uncharacterized protein n=1 Tax=Armillaria luteobubalina TaxID=153913 RepID=A0AA39UQU7_9AGAR|nr:hypothetical protein EDD18DRAFT_1356851 [Armillaria luteobubalina]
MAPPGWCTPEQSAWFTSHLVNFHKACLENAVGKFLGVAMKEFMETWPLPECAEEIIGDSPEAVAKRAEQFWHYKKWKNQMKGKFNNNRGKAHVVAMSAITGKTTSTSPKKKVVYSLRPQHRLQAVQIYSKCYYNIRVQASIKKAIRLSRKPLTHGQKLTIINKLTHEKFQTESDEVKTEIFDALEQLREEQTEASQRGQQNPKDYLDAIDAEPAVLDCFLNDLAEVEILPMGEIFVQEAFIVNPKDSNTCRMTFEEGIITPYGQFLKTLFSPQVRAQQACNAADLDALNETLNDDKPDATPGMSGLISMPPSPPSPSIPSFLPPSMPIAPCPAQPLPLPQVDLSSNETSVQGPVLMPLMPLTRLPSSSTPTNADATDSDFILCASGSGEELGGDEELDPQLFWQDASFGHEYFSMGHAVLDHEGDSFPLTSGAMFGDDDGGVRAHSLLDVGFPSEQYNYPQQSEPEGSQLLLLPRPDSDRVDEHEIDPNLPPSVLTTPSTAVHRKLTPVRIANNKPWKRQGEEASAIEDEDGGEDHERRTSKHARKPPASCASWVSVGRSGGCLAGIGGADFTKQVADQGLT